MTTEARARRLNSKPMTSELIQRTIHAPSRTMAKRATTERRAPASECVDHPSVRTDVVYELPHDVVCAAARQHISSTLLPCRVEFCRQAVRLPSEVAGYGNAHALLLCVAGRGQVSVEHRSFNLAPGGCVFALPFERFTFLPDSAIPTACYMVHFNGTMAAEYFASLTYEGHRRCVHAELEPRLLQSFGRLVSICGEARSERGVVQAASALHHLLGELYGVLNSQSGTSESSMSRVKRAVEVVQRNVEAKFKIDELAADARMSHVSFAAKFREQTGETPRRYVSKLKIIRACELLSTTALKVENVARMVGYEDPYYFSRVFKRRIGIAPSHYRLAAARSA